MVGTTYMIMVFRGIWNKKGNPLLLLVVGEEGSERVVVLVVATVSAVSRRWQ